MVKRQWIKKKWVEGGRRGVEKVKNFRFGVRGHPNRWEAVGSKAKKTALGSEVKIGTICRRWQVGGRWMKKFVNMNMNVNGSSGGRGWR